MSAVFVTGCPSSSCPQLATTERRRLVVRRSMRARLRRRGRGRKLAQGCGPRVARRYVVGGARGGTVRRCHHVPPPHPFPFRRWCHSSALFPGTWDMGHGTWWHARTGPAMSAPSRPRARVAAPAGPRHRLRQESPAGPVTKQFRRRRSDGSTDARSLDAGATVLAKRSWPHPTLPRNDTRHRCERT